ncbi:MAG: hypothetical protein BWY76_03141 [bacterium ADurb.Bin429]|nr:MAG: hypothetical protein BWY76_03141 [bacterium ADurb.Bin429]
MKMMQMLLVVSALLVGALAYAQPQPGDHGQRQPKPERQAVTVSGTVKEVKVGAKDREQLVHLLLETENGPVAVGLGPVPYLAKIGLKPQQGDKVAVNGWKLPKAEKAAVMARDLTVNGKTYTFRDAQGKPAWSPFEFMPQVTVQGTIKEIVMPERPQKPANGEKPAQRPQKMPGIVVTTDKGDVTIIGVPAPIVEKLGLKLEVGMKVSVTGWQTGDAKAAVVMARTITANGKTITLRDEAGKPIIERKEGDRPKPNGGKPRDGQGGKPRGEGA